MSNYPGLSVQTSFPEMDLCYGFNSLPYPLQSLVTIKITETMPYEGPEGVAPCVIWTLGTGALYPRPYR